MKQIYVHKREFMKDFICEQIEKNGHVVRGEIMQALVDVGYYKDAKVASTAVSSTLSSIKDELHLTSKNVAKKQGGYEAWYLKESSVQDKEETETSNAYAGDIRKMSDNINYAADTLSKMLSLVISIQTKQIEMKNDIDKRFEELEKKIVEGMPKQKPRATVKEKEPKQKKGFSGLDIEVENYMEKMRKADIEKIDFEKYDSYIRDMTAYISQREGLICNQIRSDMYKEMHNTYGYCDSEERKAFLKGWGRPAVSGVELMYNNLQFRKIFYNKFVERLSRDYKL